MKKQMGTVAKIQKSFGIVGRGAEIEQITKALRAGSNLLIEGPVGVGKTVLAQAIASSLGIDVIRIDGDSRFTEQKLTGWFDPSLVLKKGYTAKTFIAGPLVDAMKNAKILFINEINRMPEAVQNVLLPAIDEGLLQIPQLGEVRAKKGFLVIATQNPREFVATSHISEALMDRMEWIQLGYQSFEEEQEIARNALKASWTKDLESYLPLAVEFVRLTRNHPKIKRGASVRASISILKILTESGKPLGETAFWNAVRLAIPSRIELASPGDGDYEGQVSAVCRELLDALKKNSRNSETRTLKASAVSN